MTDQIGMNKISSRSLTELKIVNIIAPIAADLC